MIIGTVLGQHDASILAQPVNGVVAVAVGDQHLLDAVAETVAGIRPTPLVGEDVLIHLLAPVE